MRVCLKYVGWRGEFLRTLYWHSLHSLFEGFIFYFCCLSLAGNLGHDTWVSYSSRKSSATHSYQCVQYGMFNVRTNVDVCDCTQALYGQCREPAMCFGVSGGTVEPKTTWTNVRSHTSPTPYRWAKPAHWRMGHPATEFLQLSVTVWYLSITG